MCNNTSSKASAPLYSGKQMASGDVRILSANKSFLLRNRITDVSMNQRLLQMESNSFMLSAIRFWCQTHTDIGIFHDKQLARMMLKHWVQIFNGHLVTLLFSSKMWTNLPSYRSTASFVYSAKTKERKGRTNKRKDERKTSSSAMAERPRDACGNRLKWVFFEGGESVVASEN